MMNRSCPSATIPPVEAFQVERELDAARWLPGFAPPVEARFEADTGLHRSRELVRAGVAGILIYDFFLIKDWLTRPEVLGQALFWRIGVVTVIGALVLLAIHRGMQARWREASMAGTIVMAMFASCMIFLATPSSAGIYDPFSFGLFLIAGNVVMALRFPYALAATVLSLVVMLFAVLSSGVMPSIARGIAMNTMVATALFTLIANHRMEQSTRKAYLWTLREELRSHAALETARLYELISQTDALTGLPNRRAFEDELRRRWEASVQSGKALAVLVIDVDNFKRFNDRFGHAAGDECLRHTARVMRRDLREVDFIARLGGEEFVALMLVPHGDVAASTAERLRAGVEALHIAHDGLSGQEEVTVSIGVAVGAPPDVADPDRLLRAADAAMYEAKNKGRNCWVLAGA
jgi:diguanylate cyclase (GGDEF)-like protein